MVDDLDRDLSVLCAKAEDSNAFTSYNSAPNYKDRLDIILIHKRYLYFES